MNPNPSTDEKKLCPICGVSWECIHMHRLLAAIGYPAAPHEFTENPADYSMCLCGIPGLDHDLVMAQWATNSEHPGVSR